MIMEKKTKMREMLMLVLIMVVAHGGMAEELGEKTQIVGRDGLCLESGGPSRWNFPKLVQCKPQEETQLWTFPNDGTIRWTNDRCLFPYGMEVLKQYILVKTGLCNELKEEDKTWAVNKNGNQLIHVHSGLVLTVRNNSSNTVNVEPNRNAPSQIWNVVGGVRQHPPSRAPLVGHIVGLQTYKCLWCYPAVSVDICSTAFASYQYWAFHEDGTIRVNANSSLCLTSFGSGVYSRMNVMECKDKMEQQGWEFDLHDNTLHHPDSNLVMDVITSETLDSNQTIVVLFPRNGASTQQWALVQ